MTAKTKIWCDEDEHKHYENFVDFNEWFDSDDGVVSREEYKVDEISQPSKAFYAGDKESYDQAFREYRKERRHEVLGEQFMDDHWFERNLNHFDQLIGCLENGDVVPFIGAGLSTAGGFPTWKEHLRQQGRTAGINQNHLEELLSSGQHETVIEEIENGLGRGVFTQEIRDVFSRTGEIINTTFLVTELFADTVITTNYDRLLEQAFDTGPENESQIINGMNALEDRDPGRVSIIKLHGDIKDPTKCILGKNQYDAAYGNDRIDMSLPIPKLLEYYYKNYSLLFLGSGLNNDRTVQVFQAIKEKIGDIELPQHFTIEQAPESEEELVARNAYMAVLGITTIWFEKGQFDDIESMLRLARNELRYRGVLPRKEKIAVLNEENAADHKLGLISRIKQFLPFKL